MFVKSDRSTNVRVKGRSGRDLVSEATLGWVEAWMQMNVTFERLGSGGD